MKQIFGKSKLQGRFCRIFIRNFGSHGAGHPKVLLSCGASPIKQELMEALSEKELNNLERATFLMTTLEELVEQPKK